MSDPYGGNDDVCSLGTGAAASVHGGADNDIVSVDGGGLVGGGTGNDTPHLAQPEWTGTTS